MTTFDDVDNYLAHFGVKGMRWGVRKERDESDEASAARRERFKKAAIATGVLTVAAGSAYVAYTLNKDGKLPVKSLRPNAVKDGKNAVSALIHEEPTSVIHASRGKDVGFRFLKKGGVPDPMHEYEKAFNDSMSGDLFQRLPDGKVAVRFMDPEGRKDFAGRLIPHEVIVPATMSSGLNSVSDVVQNLWPILKPAHDEMYVEEGSMARRMREEGKS